MRSMASASAAALAWFRTISCTDAPPYWFRGGFVSRAHACRSRAAHARTCCPASHADSKNSVARVFVRVNLRVVFHTKLTLIFFTHDHAIKRYLSLFFKLTPWFGHLKTLPFRASWHCWALFSDCNSRAEIRARFPEAVSCCGNN